MENDLIRRSELKRYINHVSSHWLCEWDTLGVLAAVDSIPAVDAVPVVPCKDCVHHGMNTPRKDNWCSVWAQSGFDNPDYYCADGAKMDEVAE